MLDIISETFHALTMDAFKKQSRQVAVARAKGLTVNHVCNLIEVEIIKLGNAWKKYCADEINKRDAEIVRLRAALQKAVDDYGKPGGPWNVPSEPGTWLQMAKEALRGDGE